jgi:anti-anti-sigma regulatory factor
MKGPASEMRTGLRYVEGATVAEPVGTLDVSTYKTLRDTLLKCASEQPDVLLVDVEQLEMPSQHALAVFSSVAMQISEWPGVPLMLVAGRDSQRSMIEASSIGRFVPVHETIRAAVAARGQPPLRVRAMIELLPLPASARRARHFVRMNCQRWWVEDLTSDAMTIANAFVENTLQHTGSVAFLRLELRRGLFTVAVSDDDPHPAVLHERAEGGVAPTGLLIVSGVARAWGCTPTMNGGKTVWATLRSTGPADSGAR